MTSSSSTPRTWLFVLALAGACAGGLDDPDRFRDGGVSLTCPDGYDVEAELLAPRCGVAGCHAAVSPQAGLDLLTAGARARMLGSPATSSCLGAPLVDSASPEQSVLYLKVAGTQCGARMPSLGDPLSATEIECLRLWIAGTSTTS